MLDQFARDGYIHIPGFFSQEEVDPVALEVTIFFKKVMIHRAIVTENPTLSEFNTGMKQLFKRDFDAFVHCGKTAQNAMSLYRMGCSDKVEKALQTLGLAHVAYSTRPVLFFNHPDLAKREIYYKTPAHQDWRSIQGSLNSVVMWVPLVDVYDSMGPLQIIPGSHRYGLQTTKVSDNFGLCEGVNPEDFVSVPVKKGDALFLSTFLVHRSGDNVADNIRWSCHFRYNDLEESTYVARGYPSPYKYAPDNHLITPGFPTLQQVQGTFKSK